MITNIIFFYVSIALVDYIISKYFTPEGIKMLLRNECNDVLYKVFKIACVPYIKINEIIKIVIDRLK